MKYWHGKMYHIQIFAFAHQCHTSTPQSYPIQSTLLSSHTSDAHAASSPSNKQMLVSPNVSPFWVPSVNGPVLSVLDVAPLSLIGRYMDDIDTAVQGNRWRFKETISDICLEKEPLFPLPNFPSCAQANCEVVSGMGSSAVNVVPSSPTQPPKKSLATAIVESTKKQSSALVPRENLAQRFYPLFNPALYPHKPPRPPPPPRQLSHRVLYTDAEDELLALGLMEYNTDWKAIQQRFLPCKSKHQVIYSLIPGLQNAFLIVLLLERAIEECGDDLDSAIRSLSNLRLSSAANKSGAASEASVQPHAEGAVAANGEVSGIDVSA